MADQLAAQPDAAPFRLPEETPELDSSAAALAALAPQPGPAGEFSVRAEGGGFALVGDDGSVLSEFETEAEAQEALDAITAPRLPDDIQVAAVGGGGRKGGGNPYHDRSGKFTSKGKQGKGGGIEEELRGLGKRAPGTGVGTGKQKGGESTPAKKAADLKAGDRIRLGNGDEYRVTGLSAPPKSQAYDNERGDKVDVQLEHVDAKGAVTGRTSTRVPKEHQFDLVEPGGGLTPEGEPAGGPGAAPEDTPDAPASPKLEALSGLKPSELRQGDELQLPNGDRYRVLGPGAGAKSMRVKVLKEGEAGSEFTKVGDETELHWDADTPYRSDVVVHRPKKGGPSSPLDKPYEEMSQAERDAVKRGEGLFNEPGQAPGDDEKPAPPYEGMGHRSGFHLAGGELDEGALQDHFKQLTPGQANSTLRTLPSDTLAWISDNSTLDPVVKRDAEAIMRLRSTHPDEFPEPGAKPGNRGTLPTTKTGVPDLSNLIPKSGQGSGKRPAELSRNDLRAYQDKVEKQFGPAPVQNPRVTSEEDDRRLANRRHGGWPRRYSMLAVDFAEPTAKPEDLADLYEKDEVVELRKQIDKHAVADPVKDAALRQLDQLLEELERRAAETAKGGKSQADSRDPMPFGSLADLPELAAADDGQEQRSEITLMRLGKYRHPKFGRWNVTADTFEAFLRNFEGQGRVPIDFDHAPDRGGSTEAAGWITALRVDGDELKANVEWTNLGAAAIREKRYLFISPTWAWAARNASDEKIGPKLIGAGMTNRPFFDFPALNLTAAFADDGLSAFVVPDDDAEPDAPATNVADDGDVRVTIGAREDLELSEAMTLLIRDERFADAEALLSSLAASNPELDELIQAQRAALQTANANRAPALQVNQPFLRRYPIDDEDTLKAALTAYADVDEADRKDARSYICARASELELNAMLPEDWQQAAADAAAEPPAGAEPDAAADVAEPSDSRAGMTDELRNQIASAFGLEEDCSDEELLQKASEAVTPTVLKGVVVSGEGEVVASQQDWLNAQERAEAGDEAVAELAEIRFESAWEKAVRQGRVGPAQKAHFENFYAASPQQALTAMAEAPPLVSTQPSGGSGHRRTATPTEQQFEIVGDSAEVDRDSAALVARAEAYCAAHPGTQFADVYVDMDAGRL